MQKIKSFYYVTIIVKNHLRLLKNWLLVSDINIYVSLTFLILLFPIFLTLKKSNPDADNAYKILSIVIFFILPLFLSRHYLKFFKKENNLLETIISAKLIFTLQKALSLFSSILFLIFLLFFSGGIIFYQYSFLQIIGMLFPFLLINYLQPYFLLENQIKEKSNRINKLWIIHNPSINLLPIRSIILRDLLFLFRNNKKGMIKYLLFVMVMNFFLFLFFINNEISANPIIFIILQSICVISLILDYSIDHDIRLLRVNSSYINYVFKGEFVFWLAIFLLQICCILPFLIILNSNLNFLHILQSIIILIFYLAYAIVIRLYYRDSSILRSIVFAMGIIPLVSVFIIFKFYRDTK